MHLFAAEKPDEMLDLSYDQIARADHQDSLLADRAAQRVAALAQGRGATVRTRAIGLRGLATDITTALTSQLVTPALQQAVDALGAADGIIAATPSTRPARAGCSPRSSTCSTTTC